MSQRRPRRTSPVISHSFTRSVTVPAPPAEVWARVVTPEGINDELRPWMTMSIPRGAGELSIDTVQPGQPLGRCWIRLFGILPVEYDDLTIADLQPGRSFHEKSTMLSFSRWEHQRRVEPHVSGGTVLTDRITFEPRIAVPGLGRVLVRVLRALFGHRHRRLVAHFAGGRRTP